MVGTRPYNNGILSLPNHTFITSQGGVSEICKRIGIETETLSNMLSNEDATQLLDTFRSLLNTHKNRLVIEDIHAKHLSPV